jgi:hexosaminidase
MNKSLLLVLFAGFSVHTAFAQKGAAFDASHLKVTWELSEINYKKSGEMLSVLTLTNTGTESLPAKGWTIYFNGPMPKNADHDTTVAKVGMVNGDFVRLSPGRSFTGLAPNAAVQVKLLTRELKDITDFPKGFYIAFDREPSKGLKLPLETKSAIDYTDKNRTGAGKIYSKNAIIKDIPEAQLSPVFPTPVSYTRTAGSFTLSSLLKIKADPAFAKEAAYLADELKKVTGVKPAAAAAEGKNVIVLQKRDMVSDEAYELTVNGDQILISARAAAGAFYGIQSLKVLLPADSWDGKHPVIKLSGVSIKDNPRFGYRAFMMDIARNFQQQSEVLKLIDLLSLYKINILHMHLTDDEGWRIEIPGLPELTGTGSKRGHTVDEKDRLFPAYGSGPDESNTSGTGFLTRAQYIEILKYATTRHIKVIPEFESPGHARAAIKSMDVRYDRLLLAGKKAEAEEYLLRDLNDKSVYRSVQDWDDNVINPAVPSVYRFLEKVTDETIKMYKEAGAPLETIHFGGDEVPPGVWEKSPAVLALLKEDKSIDGVDEIWHYYYAKVNALLKKRGLYLTGWEEIGLKKAVIDGKKRMVIDPRSAKENFHTDVWNNLTGNEDLAYKLANEGYKVILTNVTNMYLDLAYNESHEEPGQYWGGYVDVDKPFDFIPLNYYKNQTEDTRGMPLPPGHFDGKEALTEFGKSNIIGIQAPLWSEIITSPEKFEYLLLPKLFGLAERSWAADPAWATEQDKAKSQQLYAQSWSEFTNTIGKRELLRMNRYAGGFAYRIPTAGLIAEGNLVKANVQLPGFVIRYTTDGSEPTVNSKVYTEGVANNGSLSFRVFNSAGRAGLTVKF